MGHSFDTIAGFGPNGAIIHYRYSLGCGKYNSFSEQRLEENKCRIKHEFTAPDITRSNDGKSKVPTRYCMRGSVGTVNT